MGRFCKQGTDLLRRTAILLPMALLAACGGGGGGGTPAAGGGGGGMQVRLEALPEIFISEDTAEDIRNIVGGTVPDTLPTPTELEMKVVDIAGESDALLFSETASGGGINASRMITCIPGQAECTAMIDEDTTDQMSAVTQMQAPDDIDGPVLFTDGGDLAGWNDAYDIVMTDRGIPLVQMRAAGRDDAGVRFAYQGYGGWLDHSVFLIQEQTAMMEGVQVSAIAAYSFGKATGTNPTVNATWNGVMLGRAGEGDIIQGDATVQWDSGTPNLVGVFFTNIKSLFNEGDHTTTLITWQRVPLMDGAFAATDGSVSGNFYGKLQNGNPPEAGGIFNRNGIFGAFGAKR